MSPGSENAAEPLIDTVENFVVARPARRSAAFASALKRIAAELGDDGDPPESPEIIASIRRAIRGLADPTLDYNAAQKLLRLHRRIVAAGALGRSRSAAKFAILGNLATTPLAGFVELFLFERGVDAEFVETDYGSMDQQILDAGSALRAARPAYVWLACDYRELAHVPLAGVDAEAAARALSDEIGVWKTRWQKLHDELGCQVVQNNFAPPPWRTLGNHELSHTGSPARFVKQLNAALMEAAPEYVTIHDVEWLAARAGQEKWDAGRYYHHAKLPSMPDALVDYAHSAASLIAAHRGRSKKCLVLDLDGTLWGGIAAEDGLGGIRLGQGDADSEAFIELQRYVLALRERGVILAVCSANDEAVAREPFEKHPETVLRMDDFACFVANWKDKATNVRAIADTLDIGLDAMVFLDDTPAERSLVRRCVSEVAAPEIDGDPLDSIDVLERNRFFQVVSLAPEDERRTEMYLANAERAQARDVAPSLGAFLESLDMTARVAPIGEENLQRAAQLINKSNQFNLTNRRRSAAEVRAAASEDEWITLTMSLTDRFGDNGLISALLARVEERALTIDTWVMSCRVLRRGAEEQLMNHLFDVARSRGLEVLRGEYVPSEKNAMVAELYPRLGFTDRQETKGGGHMWQLAVDETWTPHPTHVREVDA